ncbi:MAG: DUF3899 domain-containing protein [Candidatus Fimimonas sp.]
MKKIWKYLITALVGLVVALLILFYKDTFNKTAVLPVLADLSDAFFVPGVLLLGVGTLLFASNGGAFDMLAFGIMKLFDLFKRDLTKVKYRTFYDYRQAQKEKKRSFSYLLIVGAAMVVVAAVFLIVHYNV